MHSIRRFALRSALSAARAASPRACSNPFAASLGQNCRAATPSSIPFARAFSRSTPLTTDGSDAQSSAAPVEEAPAPETSTQNADSPATKTESTASTDSTATAESTETPFGNSTGLREGETQYGLFVRNMVFDATEEHLAEIFSKYGKIVNTVIARDPRGLSRGYGFVFFDNAESMNMAATNVNGSFWHGRRIQVNPRVKTGRKTERRRQGEGPSTCLYIGNIPYETTDAELNRLFRDLDNIKDIRVAVDRVTGWPRGFAHCDFADVESADRAMKKLRGAVLGSREISVDFADPSGKRR